MKTEPRQPADWSVDDSATDLSAVEAAVEAAEADAVADGATGAVADAATGAAGPKREEGRVPAAVPEGDLTTTTRAVLHSARQTYHWWVLKKKQRQRLVRTHVYQ
mmetsp:Transcript_14184/g.23491  ORF Transcript_14184/g.23491 Transcript_14184/m.23491 type:complete len:105 (+) Transcript_14184:177-491(+)